MGQEKVLHEVKTGKSHGGGRQQLRSAISSSAKSNKLLKKSLKKKYLLLLVLAASAGYYYFAGHQGSDSAAKKQAVPVKAATVENKDVPLTLRNVGTVVAYETVAIRSRIDSQVVEVKFHNGDYVTQGDALFVLDDRALKAQMDQAKANMERDRAQLENLKMQYDRAVSLNKKGYQSQENLDAAKAAYDAQKAVIGTSQAAAQSAKVQLEYSVITAPISGRTGTIAITTGNTVKANDTQALVTINQVKPIRVQVALPQQYLERVRSAMAGSELKVAAVLESGARIGDGKLEYIDNAIDVSTGTFAARAIFPNEDEKLWPGMFVPIEISLGDEKQVPVMPEVALQHGQTGDFVFLIKEGKAAKTAVKVSRTEGGLSVIGEGLKAGDDVAVDGLMSLKDGTPVSLIKVEGEKPEHEKKDTEKKPE